MSSTAPAIPLFGDAYLADTHHLTLEEHGAYLKLLMIAWRMEGCALPDDDGRLAQMLGLSRSKWAKLKPVVMAFWTLGEQGWFQGRLAKERAFVENRRQGQRDKAAAKWQATPSDDDLSPARKRAARLSAARDKGRHTAEEWKQLVSLTGNICVKCHASGVDLVKDHILPIYRGGSDGVDNLQPLCISCNSSNGADDTDYRLSACKDLFERLPNACRTPAPPPPPPQEKKEVVEATPQPLVSASDVRDALDFWNDACTATGWAKVVKFHPSRQASLRARLRDDGLEGWRAGIIRARASPLLAGQPPPTWFSFDFIVKPGNFAKLIEGNYDRQYSRNDGNADGLGRTARAAVSVFGDPGQAGPQPAQPRPLRIAGGGQTIDASYSR